MSKKCKSCQMEIDNKAKKCPHCQTDQRNWFRRHLILTGILVLFIIGIVGTVGSGGNKNSGQSTTSGNKNNQAAITTTNEVKVTPAPEKISARDLADDFDNNAVAAKDKWMDKFVEFSDQISNITDSGISFSNIASKQFSMTQISCRVQDKQQLLPLKNGQTVTVRGIVGSQTIGVIEIKNCEVVQ